jgi:hypothetical protein
MPSTIPAHDEEVLSEVLEEREIPWPYRMRIWREVHILT